MNNQEAINRLIGLKMSYKIRIEEEDIEALENGSEALEKQISLEDIKAEIEDLTTYCSFDVYGKKYPVYDKKEVLQILDKHIKENK